MEDITDTNAINYYTVWSLISISVVTIVGIIIPNFFPLWLYLYALGNTTAVMIIGTFLMTIPNITEISQKTGKSIQKIILIDFFGHIFPLLVSVLLFPFIKNRYPSYRNNFILSILFFLCIITLYFVINKPEDIYSITGISNLEFGILLFSTFCASYPCYQKLV